MIVSLGFNKIFKYRTSIAPFCHCPSGIFEFLFCSPGTCCILNNTRVFSHGSKQTTIRNYGLEPKSQFSFFRNMGSVQKTAMFLEKWNSGCNGVNRSASVAGYRWIHSDKSVEPLDKSGAKSVITSADGSSNEEKKKTRKKLKGKRAVVKWLKFFRWKKKKEYERMTAEEKILYKLNKVFLSFILS